MAASTARRMFVDRVAARFVSLSGGAIIASILAILVVIVLVAYPLARAPRSTPLAPVALPAGSEPLALLVDEHRTLAAVAFGDGVRVVPLSPGAAGAAELKTPDGVPAVAAEALPRGLALLLADGRVWPVRVSFDVTFVDGRRQVAAALAGDAPIAAVPPGKAARVAVYVDAPSGPLVVAATAAREIFVTRVVETTPLVGEPKRDVVRAPLTVALTSDVTALGADGRGDDLFIGTAAGDLVRVDRRDPDAPRPVEAVRAARRPGAAIRVLGFLNGDRTLVAGDAAGGVSTWQVLQPESGEARLTRIHDFEAHADAITAFSTSRRDKSFATADAAGHVKLHYGTTGKTLLDLVPGEPRLRVSPGGEPVPGEPRLRVSPGPPPGDGGSEVRALTYAPKADAVLAAGADGRLQHVAVHNPHPEITWRALFGKLWYEGYPEPAYVWQSTGGTDDFEAKFSLTPLVFGTLKGTFYALLLAVPISLLGALYTAQFMHPAMKSLLKPTIEIMAALPSVVLGFLAGLWLAPTIEKVVPGIVAMFVTIPLFAMLAAWAWQRVPIAVKARFHPGTEFLLLLPVVLLAGWAALRLGAWLEAGALAGDYRSWLLSAMGVTYDQRNSLVVGIAMGFAVIPIIFTVAEDSIASVPPGLTAGSLALGATRWQTAIRTVLPTASPGIFSAVMIGFGRAVGETMIVLMATGNTPVMDLSIFNGFRALSANIAVELPEAPEHGTLFRVLFLAALLLYLMTFTVNTVAEVVRLRLRRKYRVFE